MKIDFLHEPELEFGEGRHIDIKFGLMQYGPLDYDSDLAPRQIRVGIVGTPQNVEGAQGWLERCRDEIPAKDSKQPNLFPRFPGFSPTEAFRSSLIMDALLQRTIPQHELDRLVKNPGPAGVVRAAADVFLNELRSLVENTNADVLICAPPLSLVEAMEQAPTPAAGAVESGPHGLRVDFHDLLKARSMGLRKPVQIVLPMTYDAVRRRQKRKSAKVRQLQDEATRAWNFHTALYYKAGGVPWRLVRDPAQLTVCYVGISFYRTLDGSKLMTSVAQVFNQRGEGVVVRGGQARISKEDRQAHLAQCDALALLRDALSRYREVHRTLPARVVLHKSSGYNDEELDGFTEAISEQRIDDHDFLSIGEGAVRLFRGGAYPPLRGTLLHLSDRSHLLYTRGSVDFFETYPGMYVPVPRLVRCERTSQTPRFLAQEILALTKMNWNNTQYDGSDPITLRAARQVSSILKYLDDSDVIDPRYSFYM